MNLRQLEVFRAVMESGSTKDAARLLLISQPAVSNMIRQFEDQLGFELFQRISGRLYPTAEANALYKKSDTLFSVFEGIEDFAEDLRDSHAGTINILASPSFGHIVIPSTIADFTKKHPRVRISFDTPPHENIVEQLNSERADFALTITPIDHPGIKSKVIRDNRLVCILPPGHPLTNKSSIHPKDLKDEFLISYPRWSPIGLVVDEAFNCAGVFQHIGIKVRFCFTACSLVNCGAGVAVVDQFAVSTLGFPELVSKPFETDQKLTISLSNPVHRKMSRLATKFIDLYLIATLEQ